MVIIYIVRVKRYGDYTILVSCKDSIPLKSIQAVKTDYISSNWVFATQTVDRVLLRYFKL